MSDQLWFWLFAVLAAAWRSAAETYREAAETWEEVAKSAQERAVRWESVATELGGKKP